MSAISLDGKRAGTVAVAACATLSFAACITVFVYSISAYVRSRLGRGGREGLLLLQTQFGALFLNLLAGDLIQSIGFGMNYIWYGRNSLALHGRTCATQAVFIQVGDVASSLFTLLIAIHTLFAMALRRIPPTRYVVASVLTIWVVVAILSGIGPAAIKNKAGGPFYAEAGGWCWISEDYDLQRLILHYDIIFLTILASIFLYAAVFALLRRRSRALFSESTLAVDPRSKRVSLPGLPGGTWPHVRSGSEDSKAGDLGDSRHSFADSFSFPPGDPRAGFANEGAGSTIPRAIRLRLQRMDSERLSALARRMLFYPLAYLVVCLPLAAFRLRAVVAPDDPWPLSVQFAVGSVFTLSGLVNSLLAFMTRKELFSEKVRESRKASALAHAAPHLGIQVAVEQNDANEAPLEVTTVTESVSHVRSLSVREKMGYATDSQGDIASETIHIPGKPTAGARGQPIAVSLSSDHDVERGRDWYPPSPPSRQPTYRSAY